MSAKRVAWVDIAKYICIMCVMNSHLETCTPFLQNLYSPFFLSLFFFCSGYVYRPKDRFQEFAKKKVKQLFIPWLVFSVTNIILSQILTFNEHQPLAVELFWNFLQIRTLGDGIWFVAALFVAYFPFYFFIRRYERSTHTAKVWLLLAAAFLLAIISSAYAILMDPTLLPWNSFALPWHLEYMFIAMFYMVLGYVFRTQFEPLFDKYNTFLFRLIIWTVYLGVALFKAYSPFPIYYVHEVLGIAAVISVSKVLPTNRTVLYIGQNTLICFALHGKVYSLLQTIFWKLIPNIYGAILSNSLCAALFSIVFTVVISIILIIPIWIINRWFPFIIGRKKAASLKLQ